MANRNLGNLGNLGNIIPSFAISEFSILPYNQNRKLRFKNLGKKFPRFPIFPRFPSFRPGPSYYPKNPIKNPQELDSPWEKKRVTLNSSLQLASLDSLEWVS